ncbi:hypothetical protein C8R45DRAFT_1080627 [Mycena sanguinolenta]|nr:hypothetical protein C8R45DRAFT_1080627 [Mycena sanguinolenta]
MLSSSQSESSGLKRKAEEPLDAAAVYKYVLDDLRKDALADVSQPQWRRILSKALRNPKLLKLDTLWSRRPFTDGWNFAEEVIEEDQDGLHVDEDTQAPSDNSGNKYQDAAEALKHMQHWQGVERHVMMSSEMSCRTAIDMVLIAAIDLAQKNLVENHEIDAEVSKRHKLKGPKCRDPSGRKYASWIVLHQEVEVPDQPLTDTIAAHGVLDYLIGAVPTASVTARLNAGGQFLTRDIYGRGDTAKKIRQSMTSIQEAKAESTFADEKSCAQAQAQGAAMCIASQRGSVVNTLTDGVRWQFFQVSKNTKAKKKNGSAPRRKPFKAASTRVFNIFHGRDLEIILRLLTISILSDGADFAELAAGSRQNKALTMPININI